MKRRIDVRINQDNALKLPVRHGRVDRHVLTTERLAREVDGPAAQLREELGQEDVEEFVDVDAALKQGIGPERFGRAGEAYAYWLAWGRV